MSNLIPIHEALQARRHALAQKQEALRSSLATANVLTNDVANMNKTLKDHAFEYECHTKASHFLKELIRVVSLEQIDRVEKLVNSAIHQIFPESSIIFQIVTSTKRNMTEYDFKLCRNGNPQSMGGLDSNGGGLWAVIALVLQVTFLVLSKRYPLLCLDESLVAISEKHIAGTSALIKELSEQFNMNILLISHQPLFMEEADIVYHLTKSSTSIPVIKRKVQANAN